MNRKRITSVIAVIMAVLMLLGLVFSVLPIRAYAVTQDDIDAVQQRRDELAAQQQASQEKINGLKEQQASVIEQKAALDERNAYAQEQLELIEEQVSLYTAMIEEKAVEVQAAKAVELEQLQRYRTRVRAMEESGGFSLLTVILNASSFSQLLAAIDDIGEIMEKDRQLENEYIAAREAHEALQAEYEQTKAELEEKQAELQQEKEELERMIQEASDLIDQLQEDIEKAEREYAAAEAARAAAAAEISRLVAELNRQNAAIAAAQAAAQQPASESADGEEQTASEGSQTAEKPAAETPAENSGESGEPAATPAPTATPAPSSSVISAGASGVTGTGNLMWPVPCSTRVTSRFGPRTHPITGEYRNHNGMDIDGYGHDGEAIVACDGGVVSVARWSNSYGNYILIDHGNGMQTLYAHMSGFAVKAGDTVTQGQTIGYLGATGWATGTHCHLEVYVDGSRTDPENYFTGMTFYNC